MMMLIPHQLDVGLTSLLLYDIMDAGGECMASGKLADNNTRYSLTIPKDLKTQLEMLAEKQNRSLNNLIVTVLKNYVSDSVQGDKVNE